MPKNDMGVLWTDQFQHSVHIFCMCLWGCCIHDRWNDHQLYLFPKVPGNHVGKLFWMLSIGILGDGHNQCIWILFCFSYFMISIAENFKFISEFLVTFYQFIGYHFEIINSGKIVVKSAFLLKLLLKEFLFYIISICIWIQTFRFNFLETMEKWDISIKFLFCNMDT